MPISSTTLHRDREAERQPEELVTDGDGVVVPGVRRLRGVRIGVRAEVVLLVRAVADRLLGEEETDHGGAPWHAGVVVTRDVIRRADIQRVLLDPAARMLHVVSRRIRGQIGVLRRTVHADAAVGVSAPVQQ